MLKYQLLVAMLWDMGHDSQFLYTCIYDYGVTVFRNVFEDRPVITNNMQVAGWLIPFV